MKSSGYSYSASRADALPWLFISERQQPLTRQSVNYLIAEAAVRAGLPLLRPRKEVPRQGGQFGVSLSDCFHSEKL
jgi:hypothetical protein